MWKLTELFLFSINDLGFLRFSFIIDSLRDFTNTRKCRLKKNLKFWQLEILLHLIATSDFLHSKFSAFQPFALQGKKRIDWVSVKEWTQWKTCFTYKQNSVGALLIDCCRKSKERTDTNLLLAQLQQYLISFHVQPLCYSTPGPAILK